ncbi:gluconate 2-dehydrogenase subunit 3 family protein [Rhodohalobacter sulfatireducens]|uniref:Gluconate 2-dehydrogenase subunit 3 family protein n=1 Tax=Rhodohalobacter sulfatireducens TaxID=2911366 RepID=A0ABS9KDB8_9BACT|nr:gluconate 2-dehydrogenase subunit 3 family protein [Rhodohalobacter sulfatireducens]MCG2588825.1 gluconate 2-dehydrogenase subunit 3 family protein [Rhodohalobacter sulfatireducens]MDR9364298.1 gluconate 2-dehydrogenase subunit 3 family protein [Balneolaceae bacterium]MDR9408230.1 gluconate 2-dehydrogenase subunit 3 family protein [Balneolaceae bacterium]
MDRREALKNTALLTGGILAGPSLLGLLQSCTKASRLDWQPLFLNEDQALFISAFVDTILPATDTPGALDVNVDIFIDLFFEKSYDAESQQQVRDELDQLNAEAEQNYGAPFIDLNNDDRKQFLLDQEEEGGTFRKSVWGTAVGDQEEPPGFYKSLKSLTLWAYFSSEKVGEEILVYDPIPGVYRGCIPLSEDEKSWSL